MHLFELAYIWAADRSVIHSEFVPERQGYNAILIAGDPAVPLISSDTPINSNYFQFIFY
jgi:hypothetical protein